MPALSITIPHSLGQAEATSRLQRFLDRVKARYQDKVSNLEEEWQGNTLKFGFSTFGFNIKGDLAVEEDKVVVNGSLPLAAIMFKGKIEQGIRDELAKLLS